MSPSLEIGAILTQYAPLMARIASTHEADRGLQQDLIQDISLAVWRALESYRAEASLKTFIARIAHNRAVDHVLKETRRQDRHQLAETDTELESPDRPSHQDDMRDLMAGLHRLPLGQRQVLALLLEGFKQGEVAQILGISESAVAQRSARARQELEQFFNRR